MPFVAFFRSKWTRLPTWSLSHQEFPRYSLSKLNSFQRVFMLVNIVLCPKQGHKLKVKVGLIQSVKYQHSRKINNFK